MATAPLHLSLKSPPDQSSTGCLLQAVSSAVQEQGGLSPWGRSRQEAGAGSVPRWCGFYSLLQSRRERTPACWELRVPVHPLSPAALCAEHGNDAHSVPSRASHCQSPPSFTRVAGNRTGRSCFFLALILCEWALENRALHTQLLNRGRLCCKRTLHSTSASTTPQNSAVFKGSEYMN